MKKLNLNSLNSIKVDCCRGVFITGNYDQNLAPELFVAGKLTGIAEPMYIVGSCSSH